MREVLLDSDILSALMRRDPKALSTATRYLAEHGCFTFSVLTRYEILRGLSWKGTKQRVAAFERFCSSNRILPVTDDVADAAARIYADLRRRGELVGDADMLIAASALVHRLGVATNNVHHFARVEGLHVENWLEA